MSKLVWFEEVVCRSESRVLLIQSTLDPSWRVRLVRDGANTKIVGKVPEGEYLFLFRIMYRSDNRYSLPCFRVAAEEEAVAQPEPAKDYRWHFDELTGRICSEAWAFPTPHRSGRLVLEPGAWRQLEAVQQDWTPDDYITNLCVEIEKRGVFVAFGREVISTEVMALSNLLNELEDGRKAKSCLSRLATGTQARLQWQKSGGPEPLYNIISGGTAAAGYGWQLAEHFHQQLDQIGEILEEPISRDGLIRGTTLKEESHG